MVDAPWIIGCGTLTFEFVVMKCNITFPRRRASGKTTGSGHSECTRSRQYFIHAVLRCSLNCRKDPRQWLLKPPFSNRSYRGLAGELTQDQRGTYLLFPLVFLTRVSSLTISANVSHLGSSRANHDLNSIQQILLVLAPLPEL